MNQVLKAKQLIFFYLIRALMVLHRGYGLLRKVEKNKQLFYFLK